ncbi:MAG: nitrate reductase [Planctomycetota bacterium]
MAAAPPTSLGHAPPAPLQRAGLPVVQPAQDANRSTTRTTCPYCGVGCVLDVKSDAGDMRSVHAPADVAPNLGMMCPKGAFLFKSDAPDRRLTTPMVRDAKGQPLRKASWDEALSRVVHGVRQTLATRGADGLAWYGSGQLDSEASYLFTKLFKGHLGSNHTDTNSRLCMSSAVSAYVQSFGSDGPPTCYDDIEHADTFFILGANMTANHPVLFNRVRRRRATRQDARVIVVDPRRSKTAQFADLHLPVAPGGDVALLRLLAKRLLERGWVDRAYIESSTEGGDAFVAAVEQADEAELLRACGLTVEQIDQAASAFAPGKRVLSFYCMGANQSTRGVDKNRAIIDLHLMQGTLGREGAGPFSLTGQPNAMGGREVGYLSHQLPGYRFVHNQEHRAEVEQAWGLAPGSISPKPGRPAVAMFEAGARGELGLLWVTCTNPAVSMPDLSTTQSALRETPCVVVQDCFVDTETAAYADVLLPAAPWGEKVGTMTNSERFITRSERVRAPMGESRPDWRIVADVARALDLPGFDFASPEEVWDQVRELSRGRLCDQFGATNDRLRQGGVHWPCPDPDAPGQKRLYTDGRFATPTGRARFSAADYAPTHESPNAEHPLHATTGRVAAQWHTRARTGNVPELVAQSPEPRVEVHPQDAQRFGVADDGWAYIHSRHGSARMRVRCTQDATPGRIFLPFHWGDAYAPDTAANYATHRAVDAKSGQPELKHFAARLAPADPPTEAAHA